MDFGQILSEREKRVDQVGHMTIDSEVVLDPDRNCRNESAVIDLNAIFYCLNDFRYRYLLCFYEHIVPICKVFVMVLRLFLLISHS